jgi:hypothetical protein
MILTELARLEGRNGEVWRRHVIHGWTQERCAEHFKISQQYVSEIIATVRASIPAADRAELITASIELIHEVKRQALEIADMAGAPVAVGKDGAILYDPEKTNADGSAVVVRDYSGRLRALDMALKADDVLAKRLGLDAASKTESTATVRYELVGVDPDALT